MADEMKPAEQDKAATVEGRLYDIQLRLIALDKTLNVIKGTVNVIAVVLIVALLIDGCEYVMRSGRY